MSIYTQIKSQFELGLSQAASAKTEMSNALEKFEFSNNLELIEIFNNGDFIIYENQNISGQIESINNEGFILKNGECVEWYDIENLQNVALTVYNTLYHQ